MSAAGSTAARRTSFGPDRHGAQQLAVRCRQKMVAASCRTDRRRSGGARWSFSQGGDLSIGLRLTANSVRLWLRLSLTLEYVAKIERALQRLADLPQPDVVVEMRLWIAFGYAIWYSGTRRDRLEVAFARAMELAHEVEDCQPSCTHGGACGPYGAPAANTGKRWQSRTITLPWPEGGRSGECRAWRQDPWTDAPLSRQPGGRGTGTGAGPDDRAADWNRHGHGFPVDFGSRGSSIAGADPLAAGFSDQARAVLHEAIDASQRADHWFSLYYTVCLAGCPLALWIGDLAQTQAYLDMTVNNAANDRWKECWALMLRLRKGSAPQQLVASFLEPRLDLSTAANILQMASLPVIPVPQPDEDIGEAQWNLPEVLRVNAELLLWHGGPGAVAAAEAQLLRSLDVARRQASLSWELRSATSLARLWHRRGRGPPRRTC